MSYSETIRHLRDALVMHSERLDLVSGDVLLIRPDVDDTGALNIGDGTYDMDLKAFLGATTKYVLFDVGSSRLQLEDVDVLLGDNDQLIFGDGSDRAFKWNGTYLECGPATGLWAGAPSIADPRYHTIAHEFFDGFAAAPLDAAGVWLEIDDAGTGTNAIAMIANGAANVVTAAVDNDYHAISSTNECFLFASGKKLWFEARFKLTEANTNESSWWFGLTDTLTTGGIQADAAGPLASYDGVLISKEEGSLEVDFETSNAATQATKANDATFVSAKWSRVGFYFDGTATTSVVTPYYDMNEAGVWTAGTAKNITLAGLQEMHLVAGVKAGPSGGAETLVLDYIKCVQLR